MSAFINAAHNAAHNAARAAPLAKKRFGQHFLHDPAVIEHMVRCLDPQASDTLVEIGPGAGALTVPLLRKTGRLTAIELDRDVIPHLRAACGDAPGLTILEADALGVDYGRLAPPGGRLRLVGNLPYNISTPLLFHLLGFADAIADMHFMLQKEVVDRMAAGPGEDAYGRLSVTLAARAEVTPLFDVGPGAFRPPPKVWSSAVRLVPRAPGFEIRDAEIFDRVVGAAFAQRRKTLSNALKGLCGRDQLVGAGLDPQARAEVIPAEGFARLANQLATGHPS